MMSMNWLDDTPVFAGQKLVVVGGSSGMGRQAAADVVAAGGSPAPSGTSTAASWPDATSPPPARPCTGPAHGRA